MCKTCHLHNRTLEERFWEKVDKNGPIIRPELGPCWLWIASTDWCGYGVLRANHVMTRAHRISWMLTNGPIPVGMDVLHKCDNRSCTNLAHLFLGTNQDNINDMLMKGRQARSDGENHGMHKLVWKEVCEIRTKYANGSFNSYQLADIYHVHPTTINHIINNDTWRGK